MPWTWHPPVLSWCEWDSSEHKYIWFCIGKRALPRWAAQHLQWKYCRWKETAAKTLFGSVTRSSHLQHSVVLFSMSMRYRSSNVDISRTEVRSHKTQVSCVSHNKQVMRSELVVLYKLKSKLQQETNRASLQIKKSFEKRSEGKEASIKTFQNVEIHVMWEKTQGRTWSREFPLDVLQETFNHIISDGQSGFRDWNDNET